MARLYGVGTNPRALSGYSGSGGRKPLSGIGDVFNSVTSAIAPAVHILEDPALPIVANRITVLHQLEQTKPTSSNPRPSEVKGIGLKRVVPALDAYIWYRKNPIAGYAALAALFLVPFMLGKMSRR